MHFETAKTVVERTNRLGPPSYRGDKLWTKVIFEEGFIPRSLIQFKVDRVIDALSNGVDWSIGVCDEGKYSVAIWNGTKDVQDHMRNVSVLVEMYKRDRLSYTDIKVIDARVDVVGMTQVDFVEDEDDEYGPINMQELIRGKRCHNEPIDDSIRMWKSGSISNEVVHLRNNFGEANGEACSMFVCEVVDDRRHDTDTRIRYLCSGTEIYMPQEADHWDRMRAVRRDHKKCMKDRKIIGRALFYNLVMSYFGDVTLSERERATMITELALKYALGERQVYRLGGKAPSSWWRCGWDKSEFRTNIGEVHDIHAEWLLGLEEMGPKEHKYWVEVYKWDPVMTEETQEWFTQQANMKLTEHIFNIKEREMEDMDLVGCRRHKEAYSYWANL